MADDTSTQTIEATPAQEPEETTDWKAKYEEAIKHSRKWEDRSKANKDAATKLEELENENAEKAKKLEELEKYKAEMEHKTEREQLLAKVSNDTGIPADLIAGDTEEEMRQWAQKVDTYLHPKPKGLHNLGSTPQHEDVQEKHRSYMRQLFSKDK